MELTLHPEAAKWFDEKARELAAQIVRQPPATRPPLSAHPGSMSHRPTRSISSANVKDVKWTLTQVDDLGNELAKYVPLSASEEVGFNHSAYSHFKDFVQNLAERPELKPFLSFEFLEQLAFDWLMKAYLDPSASRANLNFTEHLVATARTKVRARNILIPISYFSIENPFQIGKVQFTFLTKQFWDSYEAEKRGTFPGSPEAFEAIIQKRRDRYQGTVVATIHTVAEEQKALQIAQHETIQALTVLRVFSPSVFALGFPSYLERMGHAHIPTSYYLISEADGLAFVSRQEERGQVMWHLSDERLKDLRKVGLDAASELISRDPKSNFETSLLASLSLFSKGIETKDYQGKLVLILTSLETLLLKDTHEPVQASLTRRFAMLAADAVDERKRVVELILEAYQRRSHYLHHGKSSQQNQKDLIVLRELQFRTFTVLSKLLRNRGQFASTLDLIDYIERALLT